MKNLKFSDINSRKTKEFLQNQFRDLIASISEFRSTSQLFDFNNPTSPISNTSNYVIDLTSDATSLTINYNLTPPNSKFIIRLVNGIVTSITNFNDIDNCPFPCTSCLP